MANGAYQEKPIRLFYSYSHRDEEWRKKLEDHLAGLRRSRMIAAWHDRNIAAGRDWAKEIDNNLSTADIILLLVSSDFIASDYCWGEEMTKALARHQLGDARVVPVILRPCRWRSTPLGSLQAVPKDGKPVSEWLSHDAAFNEIAAAIERAVTDLQQQRRRAGEKAQQQTQEARKRAEAKARQDVEEQKPVVVELTVAKAFNDFTDEDETNLRRTLKEVLTTESLPKVLARIPGSTKILLELSPEQAEQLLWLSRRGVLEAAGVTNAKLIGDSAAVALLEQKLNANNYDVFLCHNSNDKDDVRKIGLKLRRNGILPWFDEWEQQPGKPWQVSLEEQMKCIRSAAVFVGNNGFGPWQDMELNVFIRQFVQRKCPVIPVFLKACREKHALPPFLGGMTWVDFRKARPNPFSQLVWGITGVRPEDSRLP